MPTGRFWGIFCTGRWIAPCGLYIRRAQRPHSIIFSQFSGALRALCHVIGGFLAAAAAYFRRFGARIWDLSGGPVGCSPALARGGAPIAYDKLDKCHGTQSPS